MALFPMHIATRGLLDGEYGKATRGYIICPDIVPRFPSDAEIADDGSFAVISEEDLRAILADYPKLTFEATLSQEARLVATVDGDRLEVLAYVSDMDAEAEVVDLDEVVGDAQEPGLTGSVVSDRDIGDVTEEDAGATVAEIDGLVGDADDEPPHC